MSASNALENAILLLYFNNVAHANVGDVAGILGSATAGSFYIGLHNADPGEAGSQLTNETAYTGYSRLSVVRTASGWTVTGSSAVNASPITFGTCSGGTDVISHISIGTASSGAGILLLSSNLSANIAVSNGITPQFAAGQLNITLD